MRRTTADGPSCRICEQPFVNMKDSPPWVRPMRGREGMAYRCAGRRGRTLNAQVGVVQLAGGNDRDGRKRGMPAGIDDGITEKDDLFEFHFKI